MVSCDKDSADDDQAAQIVGTWHQVSRTIDGTSTSKDSTRLVMQVDENFICILCDSTSVAKKAQSFLKRSGWSYNSGLLNIAIDLPVSWKVTAESNKLSLEKVDFTQTGSITKTVIGFERMANIELQ
jgi:hypothetical protein